ncbi:DUF4391 domain-containing protein [Salinisphaera orenii]|uniref:DUF4391 domain-containing protein n=1 Tax=Salinisphaera orenii TaxID=856731 RepID=UPI000DBE0A98
MQIIHDYLALPETAYLGKRVYKKLFFENADLTAADRRAFTDDIDTVTWQYTLKPATLNVNTYRDNERDYAELAVIEVSLRDPKRIARLAELINRAIPYPMLLILVHEDRITLSTAHKRASRAEADTVIAEDMQLTQWLDPAALEPVEQAFLNSLALPELPQTHYHALYSAWHQRLLALACARLSGTFHVPESAEARTRQREALAACHQLENDIASLRAEIKKETRFNRQVELNTRIKALEEEQRATIKALSGPVLQAGDNNG